MFWFSPLNSFKNPKVVRGISGGAHPLETIFDFFNIKKSCVRVLKSIHVDKILLEGL